MKMTGEGDVKQGLGSDDLLRKYLLGQLRQEDQERLEERLMTDAGFVEYLQAFESELADEYAAGLLRGADKEAFEKVFLAHPTRQRQLEFARTLQLFAQKSHLPLVFPQKTWTSIFASLRPYRFAMITSCLIVLVGGIWIGSYITDLQRQLLSVTAQQSELEREHQNLTRNLQQELAEKDRLREELESLHSASSPTQGSRVLSFVTVSLMPGVVRDAGGLQRVVIPSGTDAARLDLVLETDEFPAYEAVLQTPEGNPVWTQKGLRSIKTQAGGTLSILLTREILKPQDYVLRISGVPAAGSPEPVSTYYFRVPAR
jgi:hypothetical protein